ncbi:toll/interleukin-1 receptor domain-containing protein [Gracilibacillus dipsosauri]|uniref:TIR domain-containing protein n=1 Tax=Gracilibacillus dipsosauri TaxID=178340 RepID=A0A317KYF5_9BACI|nr:toll/interleukin-1 receptor domain-containing protein [Gracilibacillus dipsosauri]PWU68306.1 hypothetical protein DLJ74_07590 [Gracilibacillus dipsosauri]
MKVFLSWSGNESKQLAEIFKDWLPNVLQYVEPYMSSKDITLGERWNNSIADSLEISVFGLVFVTPSNINAPWLNYEAGALSKTLESRVIPILYESDVMLLEQGPLKQFQSATDLEKESLLSLVKSINNSCETGKLDELRLDRAFEMWWPDLSKNINKIEKADQNNELVHEPSDRELLSNIFSKLSEQERLLSKNANEFVPLFDINKVIKELRNVDMFISQTIERLRKFEAYDDEILEQLRSASIHIDFLYDLISGKIPRSNAKRNIISRKGVESK